MYYLLLLRASLVTQMVKSLPAVKQTHFRSFGWEDDPLKKKMATHSSILTWKSSVNRGAFQAIVRGVAKSQNNWVTNTHTEIKITL